MSESAPASPPPDPDPHGEDGPPFLMSCSQWAMGAAIMLLLPRQWGSAGIALVLSLVLYALHRRRERRVAST